MGSIPLPALAIRPPEQPTNPLDAFEKIQRIRGLQGQQQLQQQQIQGAQLQNQQLQTDISNQQAAKQLFQSNKAPSESDILGTLGPKYGAEILKAHREAAKAQVDLQNAVSDHQTKALDYMGNLANAIKASGYNPQVANSLLDYAASEPGFEEGVNRVRTVIAQNPNALKQVVDNAIAMSTKQRETAATEQGAAARLPGEQADSQLKQMQLNAAQQGGAAPGIPLDTQEANSWLKQNPGKTLADYAKYKATLVPAFNFNLQANGAAGGNGSGITGDNFLKTLPAQRAQTVKAIAEGRIPMPTSFALKSPYWQRMMNDVLNYDPGFSTQTAELRKAYTTGPQSKEINAINTALGHVGVLGDAIDALNNGDVRLLNKLANRLGVETGNDATTVFNTIVHRVGPELSKAYIGAGGSAGERGADEKDFDASLGGQQLKSNVAITAKLLRSKIGALENQWQQNAPPGGQPFADRFLTPEAKRQLSKWSPEASDSGSGDFFTQFHGKRRQ